MPLDPAVAQAVLGAKGAGEDRVSVVRHLDRVVLAVADGAGGAGAAERALEAIAAAATAKTPLDGEGWAALLRKVDAQLVGGKAQCALAVAAVAGGSVSGASVGDCGAWLVGAEVVDLTAGQVRKPLLGSGAAAPVAFAGALGAATLLLASDGLLKYAARNLVAGLAALPDLGAAARQLVELPRLRSGALPDDIAVALCRRLASR